LLVLFFWFVKLTRKNSNIIHKNYHELQFFPIKSTLFINIKIKILSHEEKKRLSTYKLDFSSIIFLINTENIILQEQALSKPIADVYHYFKEKIGFQNFEDTDDINKLLKALYEDKKQKNKVINFSQDSGIPIVDEIENSFHEILCLKLIETMKADNKGNQMIFTSHLLELLNNKHLNKNQVFITHMLNQAQTKTLVQEGTKMRYALTKTVCCITEDLKMQLPS